MDKKCVSKISFERPFNEVILRIKNISIRCKIQNAVIVIFALAVDTFNDSNSLKRVSTLRNSPIDQIFVPRLRRFFVPASYKTVCAFLKQSSPAFK